jgi:hypothetical protein
MSVAERNRRKHFWVARVRRADGTVWRVEGLRPEVHEAYSRECVKPATVLADLIPLGEERETPLGKERAA